MLSQGSLKKMFNFPETKNGFARLRVAINRLLCQFGLDIIRKLNYLFPKKLKSSERSWNLSKTDKTVTQKPIIFASACVDAKNPGGWKYNGGIKELNNLVRILRDRGYEAYMVTYDGKFSPWLIEHQPHISITEFKKKISQGKNYRCVTSWALAKTFIDLSPNIYFWDMELLYTEHDHFPILTKLYRKKIKNTAGISRTIQAWHMANFKRKCVVLPNVIDEKVWHPGNEKRNNYTIGYMNEGSHVPEYIKTIQSKTKEAGLNLNFQLIKGSEKEVLQFMRRCEIYLSFNLGKEKLWGEGCPRTIIEALSAGCISISFDIIGNREIITDNLNGIIVKNDGSQRMADALIELYKKPEKMSELHSQARLFLKNTASSESRFKAIKDFLEL